MALFLIGLNTTSSRSFHVKCKNKTFFFTYFLLWCPHGSVLGPLLFIMYTTFLSSLISSLSVNHLFMQKILSCFFFFPSTRLWHEYYSSYSGCSLADLFFDNWMHWMQGPLTYWQSFHYNQTSISAPSHHFSTSLQHSLLISCNSCSSTIIILSTNNWSLFVICFTMPLEAAYHSLHQPHSTSK